jgi:hypothetical protein
VKFVNLTPFDTLCFSTLDKEDHEYKVIAMKVGYRLQPSAEGNDLFDAKVIDDDPLPLCLADEHYGEPNESSIRQESDLAPYKPRCDVTLRGHSYAPRGVPAKQWKARLKISAPLTCDNIEIPPPLPNTPGATLTDIQRQRWLEEREQARKAAAQASSHQRQLLMDKTLHMIGPREFRRAGNFWALWDTVPALSTPLRWEYAFGGRSVVPNPKYEQKPNLPKYLLNEVCFSNPVGCGWIEKRYLSALRSADLPLPDRLPAPRIESPQAPTRKMVTASHKSQEINAFEMDRIAQDYGTKPAGFGPVGRAWVPRLSRAGTYDAQWLEKRWPYLPKDFNFDYWNHAPVDQQIPYLPVNAEIELWNLTDPRHTPNSYLRIRLPGHRAFVLLRMERGELEPRAMQIDTLQIDTEEMMLILTCRLLIPDNAYITKAEARFEIDPTAPLVKFEPIDTTAEAEVALATEEV